MEFYYYILKFKVFLPIIKLISFFFNKKTKFKSDEFKYEVSKDFDNISKFLMYFNLYERKERELIKDLDNNLTTIEAGGGVGLISMFLKKKCNDKDLIIIEPNTKLNSIIKNNFSINSLEFSKTHIINKALSDKNGEIVEFHKFQTSMANTIYADALNYNFKKIESEKIETISINYILDKFNIQNFQLILDIEGAEMDVITKNNIWLSKCKHILLENHFDKEKLNILNNFIISKNFKLTKKKENVFLFSKK